jgi:hypothetical protein
MFAAALTAALLAGCGSFGGGSPSSSRLTPAAWKQKINGICSTMTAKTNALARPTKTSELKPYVQQIINLAHSEIAQIQAVNPPPQYAAGQKAVIADLNTVFGGLESLLSQPITASTFATALRSKKVVQAAQDYVARSKAAGLPSCVLTNGA